MFILWKKVQNYLMHLTQGILLGLRTQQKNRVDGDYLPHTHSEVKADR